MEHYDVRHDYIEDDDQLSMMRILLEARPRLIQGMNGLAGEQIEDHRLGYGMGLPDRLEVLSDGVARPGSLKDTNDDGFKFWSRDGLSKVLKDERVSIAVTPNG